MINKIILEFFMCFSTSRFPPQGTLPVLHEECGRKGRKLEQRECQDHPRSDALGRQRSSSTASFNRGRTPRSETPQPSSFPCVELKFDPLRFPLSLPQDITQLWHP